MLDTLSELNTKYGTLLAKSGAVLGNSIAPNEADREAPVLVDDLWYVQGLSQIIHDGLRARPCLTV